MEKIIETGFAASVDNFNTSAAGFINVSSTSNPASLFDAIRDNVIYEIAEEPAISVDIVEPESTEVTHNEFFGENIRRIFRTIKK